LAKCSDAKAILRLFEKTYTFL
jgi:hypothetical protein